MQSVLKVQIKLSIKLIISKLSRFVRLIAEIRAFNKKTMTYVSKKSLALKSIESLESLDVTKKYRSEKIPKIKNEIEAYRYYNKSG